MSPPLHWPEALSRFYKQVSTDVESLVFHPYGWDFKRSSEVYSLYYSPKKKQFRIGQRGSKLQTVSTQELRTFWTKLLTGTSGNTGLGRMTELNHPVLGSDESGKGDIFGPLLVAAFKVENQAVEEELKELGITDSKGLSDASCLDIAKQLRLRFPNSMSVERLMPCDYQRVYADSGSNLNRLLERQHLMVLRQQCEKSMPLPETIIVDAFESEQRLETFLEKSLPLKVKAVPRAERFTAVAAASIIARAGFLEGLSELSATVGEKLLKGGGPAVKQQLVRLGDHAKAESDVLRYAKSNFKDVRKVLMKFQQ